MKRMNIGYVLMAAVLFTAPVGYASEDFYGTIESRPKGDAGSWVVSGRTLDVTDRTQFVEEYGPLSVGACVEVEMEGKVVKKITSEEKGKCAK